MFEWDKSSERLEVSADRVLRLYRSLGEIQVALPGMPAQKSAAYLCAFAGDGGGQVVVAFHLLKSRKLAIYRHAQGEVPPDKTKGLLGEGVRFAESLGFVLDVVDFQQLNPQEKLELWNTLPLTRGGNYRPEDDAALGLSSSVGWPGPEELQDRRRIFIEKLGRFLATL